MRTGKASSAPMVIGVAGGIGSGKSAFARALGRLGCLVIDFDALARSALDRPDVIAAITGWWGDALLDGHGRIERARLAELVFSDPDRRARLEGLIHPIIRPERDALIDQARAAGAPGVVLDAPLLFEAGLEALCDLLVFVDTPRSQRLARVSESRGWDDHELTRRESAQWPLDRKRNLCDVIVRNTGGEHELDRSARHILDLRDEPRVTT